MIIRSIVYHLVITGVFCAVSVLFVTPQQNSGVILSVLAGGLVMGFTFTVLIWAWKQIFQKKSIALAGSVIVFKYAILIVIIFLLMRQEWLNLPGLAAGLSTLFPTLIVFALGYKKLGEADGTL